ncbi:MAG: hypothetical protein J6C00_11230 [Eubacterium sp.]|nr:hypothetical protein [Eubacterium sp.]
MDFNQRDYFFQMQQLRQMPYSLMYPYPDLYMSEMETERDLQYLQQMYPADAKKMQKKVEEELDKLEYEGSMMYDEYPDRVSMLLICDRIEKALAREDAERRAKEEADRGTDMRPEMRPGANADMRNDMGAGTRPDMETGEDMNAMDMRRRGRGDRDDFRFDRGRRNLLEVLLFNEMHKRRCKRRQCRRFW